ncbi:hypothetical protein CXG81DRAFT_9423 [Caulochytrium protostelioides]|uniref:J domain-containing protein n=1 Tax=Caulochytrium protostelioides TaxID=1555241 RepID=A0A4P9XDJ0_9FUNG|nr:hypothetical protein CXG81DRAFT_9423 [Caulochytrium protostelioides]|eukprot:RKP03545.1 hypothetical protein CXG81DRAFT_9423 [Caulochytrium protostelioides]
MQQAQQHLDTAKTYIAKGDYTSALTELDAAIELDRENHMSHFRRATLLISQGRHTTAERDLGHVVDLEPEFAPGWRQRGILRLQSGGIEAAFSDFLQFLRLAGGGDAEVAKYLQEIENAREHLRVAESGASDPDAVAVAYSELIRISPYSPAFRSARGEAYMRAQRHALAVADLTRATLLPGGNTPTTLERLATLQLHRGELDEALTQAKACLRTDPDFRPCKKVFREVKSVMKQLRNMDALAADERWDSVIRVATNEGGPLEFAKELAESDDVRVLVHAPRGADAAGPQTPQKEDAEPLVSVELVHTAEEAAAALGMLAEVAIQEEELELAQQLFQRAHEMDKGNKTYKEGHARAQRLIKQAGSVDYYKVLGLPRDATPTQIKKAFRAKARTYHPDKCTEHSADVCKKKMIQVSDAYAVLSDKEKRNMFDNGVDPNAPEGQGFGGQAPNGFPAEFFQNFNFGEAFANAGGRRGGGGGGGGQFPFQFHFG